jgi:hypothetical protein
MGWSSAVVLGAAALLPGGCGSASASTSTVAAEEHRLLQPFLHGSEVGCSELLIEMTGNFHKSVGQPAVDPALHLVRSERTPEYTERVWTNKIGTTAGAFVVTVGDNPLVAERLELERLTRFTALNRVTIRVFEGRRPMTLTVRASGQPMVIRPAGAAVRDLVEFQVVDGVLHDR